MALRVKVFFLAHVDFLNFNLMIMHLNNKQLMPFGFRFRKKNYCTRQVLDISISCILISNTWPYNILPKNFGNILYGV